METTVTESDALERAILRTLLYSDLFDYPLTPVETAHYLIEQPVTVDEVRACLSRSSWLADRAIQLHGYVALRGREALIARRLDRAATSDRLWPRARRFVRVLRMLPFVRMIAITGALAMQNSAAHDDIDVLIVTAPDRVWLTRALAIALVYAGKLCGDTLCPNYVISERALALDRHTLFVAHEFTQMVPVYGLPVYDRMCDANQWIERVLPNATQSFWIQPEEAVGPIERGIDMVDRILQAVGLGVGFVGSRLVVGAEGQQALFPMVQVEGQIQRDNLLFQSFLPIQFIKRLLELMKQFE